MKNKASVNVITKKMLFLFFVTLSFIISVVLLIILSGFFLMLCIRACSATDLMISAFDSDIDLTFHRRPEPVRSSMSKILLIIESSRIFVFLYNSCSCDSPI